MRETSAQPLLKGSQDLEMESDREGMAAPRARQKCGRLGKVRVGRVNLSGA